ncbi:Hypothetical protein D9617_8g049870 [Elsinoe fawcettii]|nr:Hypothetical protein D9617_8g049870 [Elsinoe fawcettii]
MSVPAARGAWTCARCRPHQSLRRELLALSFSTNVDSATRRLALTDHNGHQQRPDADRTDREYVWRKFSPENKVIGRKGRRQRADAERLKIKSLDQESSIIVLRDVPEEPSEQTEKKVQLAEDEAESGSIGDDQKVDIEKLLVKGGTPRESEIFAAIEQHRPEERQLNRTAWDTKKKALASAHTAQQLRKYLTKHHKQTPSVEEQARSKETSVEDKSRLYKDIKVTPWFRSRTPVTEPLSLEATESTLKLTTSKKVELVDQVFRRVWNVQPIEEQDTTGELEILLTSSQWDVLQTRSAKDLFGVLRKGAFFRRIRLYHDPERGALRIRGPRKEAEALVLHFRQAFDAAVMFRVMLEPLQPLLPTSPEKTLAKFTPRIMQDITRMTGAHVSVSRNRSAIWVAGFKNSSTDEALRIVTMMLGLSAPVNHRIRKPDSPRSGLFLRSSIFPIGLKEIPFRREVLRAEKAEDQDFHPHGDPEDLMSTLAQHDSKDIHISGLLQHLDDGLRSRKRKSDEPPDVSMWSIQEQVPSWRATFGSYLEEAKQNPGKQKIRRSDAYGATDTDSQSFFCTATPKLPLVTSWFDKLSSHEMKTATHVRNQLVAKFIPSPFPEKYATTNFQFSPFEIVFDVKTTPEMQDADDLMRESLDRSEHRFPLSDRKTLVLSSVEAKLREDSCVACLPGKTVDLRFTRAVTAKADLSRFMAQEGARKYIETMTNSMKGTSDLWAPKYLSVPVPRRWLSDVPPEEKSPKKKKPRLAKQAEIEAEEAEFAKLSTEAQCLYFFAGFETREVRQIRPNKDLPTHMVDPSDTWTTTDVEGGMTGGKRLEFSVQQGQDQDTKSFVQRAFSMVNLITLANQGLIKPLIRKTNPRPITADTLDEAPEKENNETHIKPSKLHKAGTPEWNERIMKRAEETIRQSISPARHGGIKNDPTSDDEVE